MTINCRPGKIPESRRGKKLSAGGFTVIETLIAMLLLAFSLAGGIAVYFNASQLKSMAIHKEIATEILSSELEGLRSQGYLAYGDAVNDDEPIADYGASDIDFDRDISPTIGDTATTSWEIPTTVHYDYADPPVGSVVPTTFRLVTVTVSWTETFQGSARQISATSYIAP